MTSYEPLYSWPFSYKGLPPVPYPLPRLFFATTYSFDIYYAYAWRDKVLAEYCLRHNFDLGERTRILFETPVQWSMRETKERMKEQGPSVFMPTFLSATGIYFNDLELLRQIKKRSSWRRLLGGVPTRVVNFDSKPGRRKLVEGHFGQDYRPYVTDDDRKDWDDVCDAADLELMQLALSFVDSVPGLDGIFRDVDYCVLGRQYDEQKDGHYSSIYTIADLRKCLSEGTPRRMTEAWKKGRELPRKPLSKWRYWLGV